MCRYNINCQEPTCLCHKRVSAFRAVPAMLPPPPLQGNLPVMQLIQHQTELIKTISQQTADFMAVLAQVSTKLDFFSRPQGSAAPEFQICEIYTASDELSTAEDIEHLLVGGKSDLPLSIRLISEVPQPVYKERAFALICEVADSTGSRVSDVSFMCKLRLFSYEKPAKLLRTNTSGDKVMHGSIEAMVTDGLCHFSNIVIKEVTSHFKNGVFFLAVAAADNSEVKPLVIENLVVKARRVNSDGKPRKRPRPEV